MFWSWFNEFINVFKDAMYKYMNMRIVRAYADEIILCVVVLQTEVIWRNLFHFCLRLKPKSIIV